MNIAIGCTVTLLFPVNMKQTNFSQRGYNCDPSQVVLRICTGGGRGKMQSFAERSA